MPSNSRLRRHVRQPFECLLKVSWKDSRGLVHSVGAKCLDFSAEGARLETNLPIPARTRVTLDSARYGNLGTASVRHCVRRALKYAIGVEFTSTLALASEGRKRCLGQIQPPAGDRE